MLTGKSQQTLHLLVIEDDRCKRTIALEAATYSIACGLSNSIVLHSQESQAFKHSKMKNLNTTTLRSN
ncbi:MAG TPA: hypothetical protein DEV81_03000 [Cyanobacteria bacterium UBA11049]|nr:hypothetical protein [Cyanobacteria bacterium UBA11049]